MFATPLVLFQRKFGEPAGTLAGKAGRLFQIWSGRLADYGRKDWVRVLLLVLVGGVVHVPALQGERIWDDYFLSRDNPLIKSPLLIAETFRHYLFLDSFSAHYRPIQNISYLIDYFFWNTDTYGFHLTNLLLHAANGVLLYFLLRHLFARLMFHRADVQRHGSDTANRLPSISLSAFFVALLWATHPVHSAAVDYISGRADSLAFFFATSGWLLFVSAQGAARSFKRYLIYGSAAAAGLLSLLSREIAVIWIFFFLAHLLFLEKRLPVPRRLWAAAACALLVAVYLALRHLPDHRQSPSAQASLSAPLRVALMARALGDYSRVLIFPTNLHMDRTVFIPSDSRSNDGWRDAIGFEYLSILGLLILAGLVCGSLKKGQGQTARIFGASWFLAAYIPISNIVPLNATVAEHWLYLPSVGFLIFVAGWALELPRRYRRAILVSAGCAVIALSVRSFIRSGDWVTEEKFYEQTLAAGGTSTRVAANLGNIYANHGNYSAAENMYRQVLAVAPDYPVALNNLADVLIRQGKHAEAERVFKTAVASAAKTHTDYTCTWMAAVNYAQVRHQARDDKAAFSVLETARAANPNVWEIISYESELLRQTKGPAAALLLVENFTRANWWHYQAALTAGRLYAEKGDLDLAETALRHASRLDVHDAEALHFLATLRLRQNRFEDAYRIQRRAIARQPDQPRQYILLSSILDKMGRGDEARAALAHVSQLRALARSQSVPD